MTPVAAWGVGIAAVGIVIWFGVPASINARTARDIYDSLSSVPTCPVAVVFGAAVYPNGDLSPVLQGRVDAAVALFHAGKVGTLLMSGDNGSIYYDEPTAMKRYAVAHGVPPQDVVRDYAGFHTFDTCYRAKHVFGVERAIFVTQAFHLPRSLFLARAMGIQAVGFVAPDNMSSGAVAYFENRERAAILGALLDVATDRKPRFPGPAEPTLTASSDPGR